MTGDAVDRVLAGLPRLAGSLEELYQDLHQHPELSMQERRTAARAAGALGFAGWEVTEHIGGTGVVGVLRNGEGPTVMVRADMDALPVREETGLPYASATTGVDAGGDPVPVMHACGHDMHVTWLTGAATLMAQAREAWRGTVVTIFQPAEETGEGARAMIDDGLFERVPRPDVVLGQHLIPAPAGELSWRPGITQAASDNLDVRLFGRGGHGSMPEASIDPVLLAAAVVMRLQAVVAREVAPSEVAVVTVGSIRAGSKHNVIPDEALLQLNVRSFDDRVRARVLAAIERIVAAEAAASGAAREPVIESVERFPLTVNDPAAATAAAGALRRRFGAARVHELAAPIAASEDFGRFGSAAGIPSVFWYVGGIDPDAYRAAVEAGRVAQEIPTNHSPRFAPVIHPTLETGVEAIVAAALAFLHRP
ncbi:MAG: amidohydrolase [Solirubrobacteraceae bacterium]